MNPIIEVDERVDVVVIFNKSGENSPIFPHKMRFHAQDITFTKLAFYHPTAQGKRMIHVFDVSDGNNDYRLEFDAERLIWVLKSYLIGGI